MDVIRDSASYHCVGANLKLPIDVHVVTYVQFISVNIDVLYDCSPKSI